MTGAEIAKLRELGMRVAWDYHGDWYSWGGAVVPTSTAPANVDGSVFDCSGYMGEYCKTVGLMKRKERITAHMGWLRFKAGVISEGVATMGDLVFWFDAAGIAKHVEIVTATIAGELYSIGASGGGPETVTRENAIRDNAFVKVRPVASRGGTWKVVNPYLTMSEAVPV